MTPTCVSCNAVFAPNHDLASMPHGKRIAFDPELGRVWRICTKCGEWNLMGAEGAAAAERELRSRLPALHAGHIVHDAVGPVDVIIVASGADTPVSTVAGLSEKRLLQGPVPPWVWIFHTVTAAAGVVSLAGFGREVPWLEWGIPFTLALYSGGRLGDIAVARAVDKPVARWLPVSAAVAGTVLCAAIALRGYSVAWLALIPASALVPPVLAWLEHRYFGTKVNTRPGIGRLSRHNAHRVSIGLGPDAAVAVFHDSAGCVATGDHALSAIDKLIFDREWPTNQHIEQGWSLLRRHRDVPGVLAALNVARPEADGRHPLESIPMPWKLALHFGIIEARGTDAEREGVRDQIAAASQVAAIAESLDRGE